MANMAARYRAKIMMPGLRTCFEAHIERTDRQSLVARLDVRPPNQQKTATVSTGRPMAASVIMVDEATPR
jgi:hypothetical protein